jgi:serine/threonine protein kinase/tetratricopeptide (TPR) repeat protein
MNGAVGPDRWPELDRLFGAVLDCAPEARDEFVLQACRGDEALRRELESLLASHLGASNFLEHSVFHIGMQLVAAHDAMSLLGRRLGPYRLVALIGSGGMGAVYLAARDDAEFQKRVAIKVIKRGMDTDFILHRFRQERQIIANLDHPNIARLLDGGTTEDGLPYFVMEYVEGERIDRYCDSRRLTIRDRLVLFAKVCAAVQYAHQNLVIHRDIKPGNILVTADGVAKLLDFGIAKVLGSESPGGSTRLSLTDVRLMTPEYASPEQVRGDAITTASDVYSLGVLLYVLLAGRHPYRLETCRPDEMARVICEAEPDKPSAAVTREAAAARGGDGPESIRRQLSGDLDNIVLKSIQQEPERRYGYAEQLSVDIGRHLSGLPVAAHPDSMIYRAAKFIRRNRIAVAAAVTVVVALAGGILISAWEAHSARVQRAIAERRYHDVRQIADSLILDMPSAIEQGPTKARAMLAQRAVDYLTHLAQDSPGDAAVQFDLAKSYSLLGQARNHPGYSNLGDLKGAMESYDKSLSMLERLLVSHPEDKDVRFYLARTYNSVALTVIETDVMRSLEMYKRSLAVLRTADAGDPESTIELYNVLDLLGMAYGHPYYSNCGDTTHALEYVRQAVRMIEDLANEADKAIPPTPFYHRLSASDYRRNVASAYNNIAGLFWATGDLDGALQYERKGIELFKMSAGESPADRAARDELAVKFIRLANFLEEDGRFSEALHKTRQVSEILEPLLAADRENVTYRRALAVNYNRAGSVLMKIGRPAAALRDFERASSFSLEPSGALPQDPETRDRLADSFEGMAAAFASGGRLDEAHTRGSRALELRDALFKLDPRNARYRSHLAYNYVTLGDIYSKQRKWTEALESYNKAIAILDAMSAADPINWLLVRARADAYSKTGRAERAAALAGPAADRQARLDATRSWYVRSLKIWQDMQSQGKVDAAHVGEIAEITREMKRMPIR